MIGPVDAGGDLVVAGIHGTLDAVVAVARHRPVENTLAFSADPRGEAVGRPVNGAGVAVAGSDHASRLGIGGSVVGRAGGIDTRVVTQQIAAVNRVCFAQAGALVRAAILGAFKAVVAFVVLDTGRGIPISVAISVAIPVAVAVRVALSTIDVAVEVSVTVAAAPTRASGERQTQADGQAHERVPTESITHGPDGITPRWELGGLDRFVFERGSSGQGLAFPLAMGQSEAR